MTVRPTTVPTRRPGRAPTGDRRRRSAGVARDRAARLEPPAAARRAGQPPARRAAGLGRRQPAAAGYGHPATAAARPTGAPPAGQPGWGTGRRPGYAAAGLAARLAAAEARRHPAAAARRRRRSSTARSRPSARNPRVMLGLSAVVAVVTQLITVPFTWLLLHDRRHRVQPRPADQHADERPSTASPASAVAGVRAAGRASPWSPRWCSPACSPSCVSRRGARPGHRPPARPGRRPGPGCRRCSASPSWSFLIVLGLVVAAWRPGLLLALAGAPVAVVVLRRARRPGRSWCRRLPLRRLRARPAGVVLEKQPVVAVAAPVLAAGPRRLVADLRHPAARQRASLAASSAASSACRSRSSPRWSALPRRRRATANAYALLPLVVTALGTIVGRRDHLAVHRRRRLRCSTSTGGCAARASTSSWPAPPGVDPLRATDLRQRVRSLPASRVDLAPATRQPPSWRRCDELGRAGLPRTPRPSLTRAGCCDWLLEHRAGRAARRGLRRTRPPGGCAGLVVVGAATSVVAIVALRLRVGPLGAAGPAGAAVRRPARSRRRAPRGRRPRTRPPGDWAEAVRERFRAIVRELEERALLDAAPGRTADEAAPRRPAGRCPTAPPTCAAAARTFDEIWYGGRPAGRGADAAAARARRPGRAAARRRTPSRRAGPR